MTASELQIMTDSRQALLNLGTRTGVDSFKRFTATLIQTMQYGTPVSDATTCSVICVPQGTGSSSCPPTTCATGSNHDVCPTGCIPEPIA